MGYLMEYMESDEFKEQVKAQAQHVMMKQSVGQMKYALREDPYWDKIDDQCFDDFLHKCMVGMRPFEIYIYHASYGMISGISSHELYTIAFRSDALILEYLLLKLKDEYLSVYRPILRGVC